jgi:hypothetical protein
VRFEPTYDCAPRELRANHYSLLAPSLAPVLSMIADDFQYVSLHFLLESRGIPVLVLTTFVLV